MINIELNMPMGLYHNLNERLQCAYSFLLEAISRMEPEVRMPLNRIDELNQIYQAICYDYPETELMWYYEKCT